MVTLLCVDNCEKQRLLYEKELHFEDSEVITATDGNEALDKVEWLHPDIIIIDISRPQIDGFEAIGRIIGKNRRVPYIIHTAFSDQRKNFTSWAVDAYIVKSPDLLELKDKIRELLTEEPASVLYNEIMNL